MTELPRPTPAEAVDSAAPNDNNDTGETDLAEDAVAAIAPATLTKPAEPIWPTAAVGAVDSVVLNDNNEIEPTGDSRIGQVLRGVLPNDNDVEDICCSILSYRPVGL